LIASRSQFVICVRQLKKAEKQYTNTYANGMQK